jgi:hypothetical protein
MPVRGLIQNTLPNLLNNLTSLFATNELAYLSIQGKNEIQIRDKVAWYLQVAIDNQFGQGNYVVCHEWGPKKGRSKVDLAVLDNQGKPIVLFEFKSHYLLNNEKYMYAEFVKDSNKMYQFCNGNPNIHMYFIFLQNVPSPIQRPVGGVLKYVMPTSYTSRLNKLKQAYVYPGANNRIQQHIQGIWNDFYVYNQNKFTSAMKHDLKGRHFLAPQSNSVPSFTISQLQNIGNSYGCPCYIAPFILGPYTCNTLNIQHTF